MAELLRFEPPSASAVAVGLLAGAVEVTERAWLRLRRDLASRAVVASPSAAVAFLLLETAALVCGVGLARALRLDGGAAGVAAARDDDR